MDENKNKVDFLFLFLDPFHSANKLVLWVDFSLTLQAHIL